MGCWWRDMGHGHATQRARLGTPPRVNSTRHSPTKERAQLGPSHLRGKETSAKNTRARQRLQEAQL